MELRKLIVVGNSLAVSLPRKFLRVLHVGASDHLEVFLADRNTLVIRKHNRSERKHYDDGK